MMPIGCHRCGHQRCTQLRLQIITAFPTAILSLVETLPLLIIISVIALAFFLSWELLQQLHQ
jgi:hypothetical protein